VVQPVPGQRPSFEDLAGHCRAHLAGYKVPKHVVLVDEIRRSPAGKADYRWALTTATGAIATGAAAGVSAGGEQPARAR
jgi:acyl-CoA synthetase (AMP-forming)/AMP-acid ligase II